MPLDAQDIADTKSTINRTGEFRVHLVYSRSGMGVKCRMWHPDGHVVGRADGGGYDKGGTALGQAIQLFFGKELNALPPRVAMGLYGVRSRQAPKLREDDAPQRYRYLDGACGKESMLVVLRALGFTKVRIFDTSKLSEMVLAEGKHGR